MTILQATDTLSGKQLLRRQERKYSHADLGSVEHFRDGSRRFDILGRRHNWWVGHIYMGNVLLLPGHIADNWTITTLTSFLTSLHKTQ